MSALRTCTLITAGLLAALVVPAFTGNQAPAATLQRITGLTALRHAAEGLVDSSQAMLTGTGMQSLTMVPQVNLPRF
jgi:hypothetical protein